MDAPVAPWWEREPSPSSTEEKSRSARAQIAGMCAALPARYMPPLEDVSRQATAKRWEVVRDLFERADVAALTWAKAEAAADVDAADLPAGTSPPRSHVLVTPSIRDLDKLEPVRRAARDAGMGADDEGGAA